jgi:heme-degrading monooxygenase HmoA
MAMTVMNKFAASEDVIEPLLEELAAHRTVLAEQPGFLNGAVYRQVGGPGRFNVINVAHWESPEAFEAARKVLADAYAEKGSTPVARYGELGVEADHGAYAEVVSY